jgi:hypothetical protein
VTRPHSDGGSSTTELRRHVMKLMRMLMLAVLMGSGAAASDGTLVIEKVVVSGTPQSGTWLMCFTAQSGDAEATFNTPDRTFSGDGITIRMNLELGPVTPGDAVDFTMHLDDDQADVCADSAEDKSADSFRAGTGSKRVNRDHFNYIVYYRMR